MHLNSGDTAWLLVSTALVFFMMPGLALFYGGLVGPKNVISTMVQSFVAIGVISVLWVVVGYGLTSAPTTGGSSAAWPMSCCAVSAARRSHTRRRSPPFSTWRSR
jgi:ammonia channel protein AmtB